MNPFDMGLLALTAGQQPALMSSALAQLGAMPAPTGMMQMPQGTGVPGMMMGGESLGALLGGGLAPPSVMPSAAPGGGTPPGGLQQSLSALQGIKAPKQTEPIMRAGVSGAQAAPQLGGFKFGSPVQDMLLQIITGGFGGKNPLRVPQLGALLGG